MTEKLQVTKVTLAVLSASCLMLSFPNFDLEFLAWVGFIPLFFAIDDQRPFKAFLISYICGVIFFLGTIYWLIHVTLPGMILTVLYLALYFGLFGLLYSYSIADSSPVLTLFLLPAVWVTLEWVRSHFLTGFPWVLLGHSQSYNLPIIQIADLVGAYGVSFLIIMANAAVFLTIKNFKKRDYSSPHIAITLLLIFLSLAYGIFRLNNIFTGERMRVSVVQGSIPQAEKWDSSFQSAILAKYEALTEEASSNGVDLVIWPETSVPGYIGTDEELFDKVRSLSKIIDAAIFAGAPREDLEKPFTYYNSAILILKDGGIAEYYDKIHLVPFGEYVPLKEVFSFVQNFASSPIGDFTAGGDYKVFKVAIERSAQEEDVRWRSVKKAAFSCLICFEDIFPDLARQFVKRGAQFLVNITNDAWFGISPAPYQHAQSSVFRAVENRVNVVRAANTGLSCFINQKGEITDTVRVKDRELFIDGFKTHEIVLTKTRTFYTVYGDVFAYICIAFACVYFVISKMARIRKT